MTRCSRRRSRSTYRSTFIRICRSSRIRQAYYSELCRRGAARVLESAAWGWHQEVAYPCAAHGHGRHAPDKHPKLKVVITTGHMGEMLPVMLEPHRRSLGERRRLSEAPCRDQHDRRAGLAHDQRHLQRTAVSSCAAYHRHRPHQVLGRLSICAELAAAATSSTRFLLAPADMAKLTHKNARTRC